jgi:Asp-tRNA(Asn)/Glu-tRNA(Gln) amidotransferase A subunit family amidase
LAYAAYWANDSQGARLAAILTLNPNAERIAEELDLAYMAHGPIGPLHGIPLVIKDNINLKGLPSTAGSAALQEFVVPDDAVVVEKLIAAGAIIIAKTTMTEFAWGMTDCIGSARPEYAKNPYNTDYASGGSSGGSAVAVSANFAVAGLGTDTGCSVRAPASITNICGLRPTHGLISVEGVIPMNLDWDTVGPLARSVSDVAEMLRVMVGDEGGTRAAVDYVSELGDLDLGQLRIGVLNPMADKASCDDDVFRLFQKTLEDFRSAKTTVIDPVAMPERPTHTDFDWYDRFKCDLNQFLQTYAE